MNKLKYFEDISNKFLLAYNSSSEFFVKFNPNTKNWEDCNISFLRFKHDYDFKEISKEEALVMTDGNLPESAFDDYLTMINKNLNSLN